MDAFKSNEILRMQYGGNKAWQEFFTKESGTSFDSASIKERYDCEIGEEWKERLSSKVEDRDFDKAAFMNERAVILQKQAERASTPMGGLGSNTGSRSASPAKPSLPPGQKARNENYFAKMGQANASRPESLAPSQGGKYAGFGSASPEPQNNSALPSADDFSRDPVAALTKGFGWFSTAVAKQAKVVNESYIQPTAKQIAESDLAAQARAAALQASQGIQSSAKGAAESLNKFVEGQDGSLNGRRNVEPERKDFWDSFGAPAEEASRPSGLGTTAIKKGGGSGSAATKGKDDGWDDW